VGTGGKIAIGCAVAVVAAGIGTFVVLGGLAYWAKGKAEEFTSEQNRIDELQRRANANPFTPPAGGTVPEDRLQKFLDVRKRVHAVYVRNKSALDALGEKKQTDFGDVRKGFALINELRLAQAQGLADAAMSEDEYRFIVGQVYKTVWTQPDKSTDVPAANLALFRKYEADLQKYAMAGLDWIGL
jgi:hypothetical protein